MKNYKVFLVVDTTFSVSWSVCHSVVHLPDHELERPDKNNDKIDFLLQWKFSKFPIFTLPTITLFSPQNFVSKMSSVSLRTTVISGRNWKQWLCNFFCMRGRGRGVNKAYYEQCEYSDLQIFYCYLAFPISRGSLACGSRELLIDSSFITEINSRLF